MSELLNKGLTFLERNQNSSFWQSAKAIPVSWNQTIMQD